MITPYGFGSGMSNWLLLVGLPLIIGLWAQFRVSSAFKKWGEVRATSNITGAEAAREILQAAQIHDVEVVETNDYLGDHYDPTQQAALPFDERLQHAVGGGARHRRARNRARHSARQSLCAAEIAHGDRADHLSRFADAAVRDYRRTSFSTSPG